jgi:hypothetical protein
MIKDGKEGGVKVPTRLYEPLRGSTEGLYGLSALFAPWALCTCMILIVPHEQPPHDTGLHAPTTSNMSRVTFHHAYIRVLMTAMHASTYAST